MTFLITIACLPGYSTSLDMFLLLEMSALKTTFYDLTQLFIVGNNKQALMSLVHT